MGLSRGVLLLSFAVLTLPFQRARAQDTSSIQGADRGTLIDFQDVDLRIVVTALAEAGGLNVVYGDLPVRKITLHMKQPVMRPDILPLLRSVAQANGLMLNQNGSLIQVTAANGSGTGRLSNQDFAAPPADIRLFVFRLKHVRAPQLAATLQAVFGGSGRGASRPSDYQQGDNMSAGTLSQQLYQQRIQPVNIDTIGQRPLAAVTSSIPAQLQSAVQIVPDETTNSILVRSTPGDWEVIRQAIETMDLRPLQVVIEVMIAEVQRKKELDVGVSGTATRTPKGSTRVADSASLSSTSPTDFLLRLTTGGSIKVDVALAALATRGNVRILSRPIIQAENNKEAKILVGEQRPFVQVFRSLPTEDAVRDQIVQYRDVGTSLSILPTINPDGYVNLQVKQEVSNATSEVGPIAGAPVISTRELSTHLFVRDGQTAVLGGLVSRENDRNRSGIPFLSSIPFLGALFGSTKNLDSNTELFLFLTPHIVMTDEEVDRIRRELEQHSDALKDGEATRPLVSPPSTVPVPVPVVKPPPGQ